MSCAFKLSLVHFERLVFWTLASDGSCHATDFPLCCMRLLSFRLPAVRVLSVVLVQERKRHINKKTFLAGDPSGDRGVSRPGGQGSKFYVRFSEPKEHESFCPDTRPAAPVTGATGKNLCAKVLCAFSAPYLSLLSCSRRFTCDILWEGVVQNFVWHFPRSLRKCSANLSRNLRIPSQVQCPKKIFCDDFLPRGYFCKSTAIEMRRVSRYFSKVSGSGVDLTLLNWEELSAPKLHNRNR